MNTDLVHGETTGEVIGAAYAACNKLGHGFLEKVCENALVIELASRGVRTQAQTPTKVRHEGQIVGEYVADLIVDGTAVVEAEAVKALDSTAAAAFSPVKSVVDAVRG
jgi:GxxExxY protein